MYYNNSWVLINKDTANTFINSLYKKTGTDSVFQIKGGTHTFAFTVGSGSGGGTWGSITGTLSSQTDLMDSLNARLRTAQSIPFDTTGAVTNYELYIDRTGGDTIKTRAATGGSGAFSVLKWRTGEENAPAAGDSLIIHNSFSGKYGEMYRGSNYGYFLESVVGDTGFTRVDDTTFKVKPPFAANEWYYIRLTDSTSLTQLTLQDHSGSAPLLLDTYGSALGAYSLFKLRTAYSGYAIKVRRSSDNTTQDIGFLSSGYLDTASMKTFVSTGTGYIDTWYDQSTNGYDLTQGTQANQPEIITSGGTVYRTGVDIAIKFIGASSYYLTNSSIPLSSAANVYVAQVYKSNSAATNNIPFGMSGQNFAYQHGSTTNKINVYAGNLYGEFANSSTSLHLSEAIYNGSGGTNADRLKYYLNGTGLTASSYSGTIPATISATGLAMGRLYSISQHHDGAISTFVIWASDKSADRTSIETIINALYSSF